MSDEKLLALAELIDETKRINGWSDMDIVRRAQQRRPNVRLTKQDVSGWRNHGMQHLNPLKVDVLAVGLRIPAYRVALAVLADQGIEVPVEVRTPEEAIRHDHTLTAHTRETVLLLIEAGRREQARQAPGEPAPEQERPASPATP